MGRHKATKECEVDEGSKHFVFCQFLVFRAKYCILPLTDENLKSGSGSVALTKWVTIFVKLGHFTEARLTRKPLVKAFTIPRHIPGAGLSITLGRCCVGQVVPKLSIICQVKNHTPHTPTYT